MLNHKRNALHYRLMNGIFINFVISILIHSPMKKWLKILLIACHVINVALITYISINGLQLRWHLGYVIFWIATLSGMALYFVHYKKYICSALSKLYAFCWVLLSVIGGVIHSKLMIRCIVRLMNRDKMYYRVWNRNLI